jgi:FkbM family methyltransferase
VLARLRTFLNHLLAPTGFTLARRGELAVAVTNRWTMAEALRRAAAVGVAPASLIDIGAARGDWSREARTVFPQAAVLLVEPLAERHAALHELCAAWPRTTCAPVLVGATAGEVEFNVSSDLDGSGVYGPAGGGQRRRVPQMTVDALVAQHELRGPFLLKLDTHGYELPIFEGAAATLAQTQLLVVEAYGFKPAPTAVQFWRLCDWLLARGFRVADLSDPMGRQRDGLFWQVDLLFLRADHPAFASDSYV